ncbi:MAG TPA: NADP-dependent malic enzyme [Burkholderiales bacterium]
MPDQPDQLRASALEYHEFPVPGKIAIQPTKALLTQRDLALAYSPGVAAACEEIVARPARIRDLTARGNLVAVVTNGTAVLGLGPIGPMAAKPVMEGKAVLFKKFAGIDVFDIEIEERDPERLVDIVAALEPTFGAINLEDIKAPECFYVERKLKERMKIPVFHDDQHGTAIIVGAAILNGLKVVGKDIRTAKLVSSGAGAAALACLQLLVDLGLPRENIIVTDIKGVVYKGRKEEMDPLKETFARDVPARSLAEAIPGADIFLGLSAGGVLKPEMVKSMAERPLILALANPNPEIMPDQAKAVRPDAVICTGRSDFPNQVNNVLCFPFIFRGALDVGATTINREMELSAVRALAELAQAEGSDVVASAYGEQTHAFGAEYLIPKPFDPRLITKISSAVARAAMDSGVATRPIADFDTYRDRLSQYVYTSGLIMKPVFAAAKRAANKRLVYAEGENERVLQAIQVVVDEGLARPIVVGRPDVISMRLERLGLRLRPGVDFEVVNQDADPRYRELWQTYHKLMSRKGITRDEARRDVLRNTTLIASLLVRLGYADAMLCGTFGKHHEHVGAVQNVLGLRSGVRTTAAMNVLMLPERTLFICDTYVNYDPTAAQLAEIALLAAEEVRRFGLTPKVALLSHSNFGSMPTPSSRKMAEVRELLEASAPELEVEGEMHGDVAVSEELRLQQFPESRLRGSANLLVMPNIDAAHIAFNLLKQTSGGGITIGPILLGVVKPAHVLTSTATVRRIVNMTALAVVDANVER